MSGALESGLALPLVFRLHGASREHGSSLEFTSAVANGNWVGILVEIVSAAPRLFLQFFLHHRILAIPQSSEGRLKVVGYGTLLLCCFFHEPALELRRNAKIQRVTLYHLKFFGAHWMLTKTINTGQGLSNCACVVTLMALQ
jgi:hypothetical protein